MLVGSQNPAERLPDFDAIDAVPTKQPLEVVVLDSIGLLVLVHIVVAAGNDIRTIAFCLSSRIALRDATGKYYKINPHIV